MADMDFYEKARYIRWHGRDTGVMSITTIGFLTLVAGQASLFLEANRPRLNDAALAEIADHVQAGNQVEIRLTGLIVPPTFVSAYPELHAFVPQVSYHGVLNTREDEDEDED